MTPPRDLRGDREGEQKGSKETRERKKEKEGRVEDHYHRLPQDGETEGSKGREEGDYEKKKV